MTEVFNDFVPTRASLLKGKPVNDYQEVSFTSYKSKGKKESTKMDSEDNILKNDLDVKKVKHEIVKLSIEGLNPLKKEEAKIQLAIKLGAKPPKNKYKNYKELIKERKEHKEKIKKQESFQQLGKNAIGKSTAKGKSFDKKRKKEGILDVYGKVSKDVKISKFNKR
ncbi:uncharacterized protein C1orf131 homolog [Sitophilus oryzae]|uniref:Uncharacterized protein C1orf131 homolog n=1 Tax=Sitophilus oryzae TaxID=7048 RepID=A0A6J2XNE8_SITOR|nr:uncharacterized protein C1orf131 homolog [Sitophilus oryzae]